MSKRSFLGLLAACFLVFVAVPAWAQGEMHKTIYTYVSEWAVPRAMWPEMAKIQAADHAQLEKFYADGTITSYGDFVNLVHQEGTPTHGDWFQSNTISGILRVLAATGVAGRQDPVVVASKHWDYFLQSDADAVGITSGTFTNAYLRVISFESKPGAEERGGHLFKTYLEPVYRQLMSDGAIIYYGVDEQYVESDPGDFTDVVIIAANAEGLDKARAAFGALFEKNPTVLGALQSTTKPNTFRSYLSVVPFAKFK